MTFVKRKMIGLMSILFLSFIVFTKKTGALENVPEWNTNTTITTSFFADQIEIANLVTLHCGQSFKLSDCIDTRNNSAASEITATVVSQVGKLSNGMHFVPGAISLTDSQDDAAQEKGFEKIVTARQDGVGIVTVSFTLGDQRLTKYLAVHVIPYEGTQKDTLCKEIYQETASISKKDIDTKNIVKRYQKYNALTQKRRRLSDLEKECQIIHDGSSNRWNITNQNDYLKEKERFELYFKKKSAKIAKAKFLSEYEGTILYFDKKIAKTELLSSAFAKGKAYRPKTKKVKLSISFYDKKGKKLISKAVYVKKGQKKILLKLSSKLRKNGTYQICVSGMVMAKSTAKYTFKGIFSPKSASIYPGHSITVYKDIYSKKVIGHLLAGKRYHCMEKGRNGWLHIRFGTKNGFVRTKSVSFHRSAIVSRVDSKYAYGDMKADLGSLQHRYGDVMQVSSLTTTVDGNNVYCVRLGNPSASKKIIIQGAMHAREWLNSQLLMMMLEDTCAKYYGGEYDRVSYQKLLKHTCFYIIPMLNPDGVSISQFGLSGINHDTIKKSVKKIARGKKEVYRRWKANARGVDLNRNFSTGFARDTKEKKSSEGYAGKKAMSEKETQALYNLIVRVKPKAVINYHEAGELLYYGSSTKLVNMIHDVTGYSMYCTGNEENGNLGDWLCAKRIDWCTPETCQGEAPVSHSQLGRQWKKNKKMIVALAKFYA